MIKNECMERKHERWHDRFLRVTFFTMLEILVHFLFCFPVEIRRHFNSVFKTLSTLKRCFPTLVQGLILNVLPTLSLFMILSDKRSIEKKGFTRSNMLV